MRAQSAQFYAGSNTALTGLVAIEQNGIVWNDSAECDGLLSAGGFADIESLAEKREVQMPPRGGFVTDNETDTVSVGQGQALFDHLTCPKAFRRFTRPEGAEGHCEGMAPTVFWTAAFDWLDDLLA